MLHTFHTNHNFIPDLIKYAHFTIYLQLNLIT